MAQVFVSYSRADAARAQPILDALGRSGLHVARPEGHALGLSNAEAIAEEIARADCVLVLWSKAAAQSDWVQQEIHLAIEAWSAGKLVLVSLDDAPLPVGLRDLETIPFHDDDATGTREVIRRVEEVVWGSAREAMTAPMAAPSMAGAPRASRRGGARWGILGGALAMLLVAGLGTYLFTVGSGPGSEPVGGAAPPGFGGPPAPEPSPPPDEGAAEPPPDKWHFEWGEEEIPSPEPSSPYPEPSLPSYEINRDRPGPDPMLVALVTGLAGLLAGAGLAWATWRWSRRRARREAPAVPAPSLQSVAASLPDGMPVFVSYSRADLNDVDRLVKQIEQAGYGVWIDRQAHGSQRYAAPIVRAIKSSQLVALMCSQNAFASDHVIREIYIAGDCKKPFLVFQLDTSEFPDEVLYFVTGFPRLSVTALDPQGLRTELSRLLVN